MHILQTPHNHFDIRKLAKHFNDGNLRIKDEALSSKFYLREVGKSRSDLTTAKAFLTSNNFWPYSVRISSSFCHKLSSPSGLDWKSLSVEDYCPRTSLLCSIRKPRALWEVWAWLEDMAAGVFPGSPSWRDFINCELVTSDRPLAEKMKCDLPFLGLNLQI